MGDDGTQVSGLRVQPCGADPADTAFAGRNRELVYTAVTRARQRLSLYADERVLGQAVPLAPSAEAD
ncbi:MAG: hypothetical protein ACLR9W_04995 [Enterobacter hormaechei]